MIGAREGPTLRSELRRGFNAWNLSVGLVTALAIGAGVLFLTARGVLPVLLGSGALPQALVAALLSFASIIAVHAGAASTPPWALALIFCG